MKKVESVVKKVIIPTYEIAEYDKNPMFLEKRVYQGSSGRVYPHPVCEGVADEKTDKEYTAVILENDYIYVMILPELGGRIQRLLDKTNGYDAVYYNQVVKPALVGLAGPWISGGIEFNWPQHHRPSTYDPVDYKVIENEDGSVTCYVGETEKMFHTKGQAAFTVYPDRAYLEIKGRVYNPTDRPQTFLWWANPAVSVNDYTRSIFPPDVNAVMDHGKRDVSKFPIADGVYYKVDYAPGTDISRYKNIPVPTSYMAYHSDYDFIGNYDDSKSAGLLHVADHHVSPGKKQWTWGNGDFGQAWDRNLTDEDGPYIELMTGMFTDNQPDFTYLKPQEEKSFVQYFMPYKKCGAVKVANEKLAVNVEENEGQLEISVYCSCDNTAFKLLIEHDGVQLFDRTISLNATESFCEVINSTVSAQGLKVAVLADNKTVLSYEPKPNTMPIPSPAPEMETPEDVPSLDELYLDGMHLEQYRHATFRPEDYYLEGLKRDAGDLRINNAYGRLLYSKGRFAESISYFEAAIKRATFRNPNPYNCEPFFNLGNSLVKVGRKAEAFDAYYKATWDGNIAGKAFYKLATIACMGEKYIEALHYVDEALVRGVHNLKARTLKCTLLRRVGKNAEARVFATETSAFDPLDMGAAYEIAKLSGDFSGFVALMRNDSGNYIELALTYIESGLTSDALEVLNKYEGVSPMISYYKYYVTGESKYLSEAEKADSLYCFPNRIEDIEVLDKVYKAGGSMAGYYLGLIHYDKGNWEISKELWETVKEKISLPTVYRNLSLLYFNKLHDVENAKANIKKAFEMDEADARVFFESDQLLKVLDEDVKYRLSRMEEHVELLERRDDLYTEYISLLNQTGQSRKAYDLMMGHKFHPWEGGEGKITKEYRIALIELAKALFESDAKKAKKLLNEALVYPHNLGEGKLIGQLDNDIYYYLGTLSEGEEARAFFKLGARGEMVLTSAMYYNDQPPEMVYFRNLCLARLGQVDEANDSFAKMIDYGKQHMNDHMKIDYFAVSLPDFLIYEGDLDKRNVKHCKNMIALGEQGLKEV